MTSEAVRNLRKLRDQLFEENKAKRNQILANYYNALAPGVQENITFVHGKRVYREKTFPQFIQLIDNRSIFLPIRYSGGDDNSLLAKAANEMRSSVESKARSFRDTGKYLNSMSLFMREIGDPQWQALTGGQVTENILPKRAAVRLIPIVEYANTLEITKMGGVLYFVAKNMRTRYRGRLSVNFSYVHGNKIGMRGGSFPYIEIGFDGNVDEFRLRRPGQNSDRKSTKSRRATRSRRGYAQVKMRSS